MLIQRLALAFWKVQWRGKAVSERSTTEGMKYGESSDYGSLKNHSKHGGDKRDTR